MQVGYNADSHWYFDHPVKSFVIMTLKCYKIIQFCVILDYQGDIKMNVS